MYSPEYEGFEFMTNILRFALPVIPMLFVLTLLFMFVPNQKVKFREAIPGALFSLIAWMVVSAIFFPLCFYYGQLFCIIWFFGSHYCVNALVLFNRNYICNGRRIKCIII